MEQNPLIIAIIAILFTIIIICYFGSKNYKGKNCVLPKGTKENTVMNKDIATRRNGIRLMEPSLEHYDDTILQKLGGGSSAEVSLPGDISVEHYARSNSRLEKTAPNVIPDMENDTVHIKTI